MMDDTLLEKALPWATSWAAKGLWCVWYGGEPLLNLDLMERTMPIWDAAFKSAGKDLQWSVTTNGTMLDARAREILDRHRVAILLSLDGPPELHNLARPYYGGKPSWQDIPVDDILAWRPGIEIAWQLDPDRVPTAAHLDWMIQRGFSRINFNLNWLKEWSGEQRIALEVFMRHVARLSIQSRRGERPPFSSNMISKLDEAFLKLVKPDQPCGTGLHMLALTPEGWLYPSQEMAFTTLEPGRAPGTDLHYRVGDVNRDPVIDLERLADVSGIRNDQMIQPPGFSCSNCVANPVSFGGCHCRYVGSDGTDPANRFRVLPGYCQSMQSSMTGLLQGAMIERYVGLKPGPKVEHQARQEFRVGV